MVNFIGRAREWALVVGLTADWLNVTTILCELPNETGMRARLLEWAMQTNRTIVLAKFGVFGQNLELEIDYRAEHVDDAVLGHLVSLLFNLAEEHYPKVFRIVNGDDVLESLERALEPGASA
jgi:hypothetical protein